MFGRRIQIVRFSVITFVLLPSICCFGQSPAPANVQHGKVPPAEPALAVPVRLPAPDTIPGGFPVRLRLTKTLDPKHVKPGDGVPFVLASDLYFRNLLLAEKDQPVKAIVQSAHGPRPFQRGSRLTLAVQSITLLDGQQVPLRGHPSTRGHIDESVIPVQAIEGMFGALVFPPAGVVSLLLAAFPGTNNPLPENTLAAAFVDGEVRVDPVSLTENQRPPVIGTARVLIVRGIRGRFRKANLFCNGTPIAHIDTKRIVELTLAPGWYRFSIKADHPNALIYAVAGRSYYLLADLNSIQDSSPDEINWNTVALGRYGMERTLGGLIADSKPVDPADLYAPGTCVPLAEEFPAPTQAKPDTPPQIDTLPIPQ